MNGRFRLRWFALFPGAACGVGVFACSRDRKVPYAQRCGSPQCGAALPGCRRASARRSGRRVRGRLVRIPFCIPEAGMWISFCKARRNRAQDLFYWRLPPKTTLATGRPLASCISSTPHITKPLPASSKSLAYAVSVLINDLLRISARLPVHRVRLRDQDGRRRDVAAPGRADHSTNQRHKYYRCIQNHYMCVG